MRLLRSHGGGSLSYSTLQETLQHFVIDDLGYIAYQKSGDYTFVLSDPICARENLPELITKFLAVEPKAAFVHINRATAEMLSSLGYDCNPMGYETIVDLPGFHPTTRTHNALTESVRRFLRDGFEIFESRISELGKNGISTRKLKQISQVWIERSRHHKELEFLLRPVMLEDEDDVRYFFLIRDDQPYGFVSYDSLYANGRLIGYCPNAARFDDTDLPTGRTAFVNLFAADRFKREGFEILNLGLSPLSGKLDSDLPYSKLITRLFAFTYQRLKQFGFSGLARHKRQYRGRKETVYYASARSGLNQFTELVAIARLTKII